MNTLKTLKDKKPEEVARLLSLVSSALLPNPGIGDVILQTGSDPAFVKSVLSEIRNRLRIRNEDYSVQTQSLIYAFLSEEISKSVLANTSIKNIESRLGDKGELHPSRYEVRFLENIDKTEALGIKRNHMVEAINHPDKSENLQPKYIKEDMIPRLTISIKSVTTKRVEDKFILFVISRRVGRIQEAGAAYRVYLTDVDLKHATDPIDIVRAFVEVYGLRFRLGEKVSKFMCGEVVGLGDSSTEVVNLIEILDEHKHRKYSPFIAGGDSRLHGTDADKLGEVVLAFVIDVSKYVSTLRKHKVHLSPEAEETFS